MTVSSRSTSMPFQPLTETSSEKLGFVDLGLLLLRLVAAVAFVYYQLIDLLGGASAYVWDKAEWELTDRFTELGLPVPGALASVFVAWFSISLLAIALGFFTRFNALVVFVFAGFALVAPLELSATLNPQTLVVYLAVFLALAVGGGGKLSLDNLLAGRKARKKLPY